ncbi:hypothetical protein JL722_1493 [Aureococcus anophagefferens]|nr:hypothetical protein JL722_1493 [Aureococcus anophagefferens]
MESPVATKKKERPPHVGDNIVEFDAAMEQACAKTLDGKLYDAKYHARWTDAILDSMNDALAALSPNFKFMCSCLLIQKRSPSNIATETVAYWNAKTDGFVHHKYESRTVVCVVHAFGCAI